MPKAIKEKPALIPNFNADYMHQDLERLGFKDIRVLENRADLEIAGGTLTVYTNLNDHDSSLVITADESTVLFQTDNMLTETNLDEILTDHQIDIFFTITELTGPFPAFFNLPSNEMLKAANAKIERAHQISLDYIKRINPRFVIPYASDVCYLGDQHFANHLFDQGKAHFKEKVEKNDHSKTVLIMFPDDTIATKNGILTDKKISEASSCNIGTYYLKNRPRIEAMQRSQRINNSGSIAPTFEKWKLALDAHSPTWEGSEYNICWEIRNEENQSLFLHHVLGEKTKQVFERKESDVHICLKLFRLKSLLDGLPAGFLSLWNGGFECSRNVGFYSSTEKQFWRWIREIQL